MAKERIGENQIVAFSRLSEFEKACELLKRLQIPFEIVSPDPGFSQVGVPALVCESRGVSVIQSDCSVICSGWADYFQSETDVPQQAPQSFDEDIFGKAIIMFFGPCMADETRTRMIIHLTGNLAEVLPYMNGSMLKACYNAGPNTLTYMDVSRMVTLYPQRIAIGKAEDLVDGWRTLEAIRTLVNQTWAKRATIVPSFVRRSKPPAIEIYKRLPGTNCKACGEQTCLAFAGRLWLGEGVPSECTTVFKPEYADLHAALNEICQGLGIDPNA
jgi:ArsR family metal-binding transcriptional regulator